MSFSSGNSVFVQITGQSLVNEVIAGAIFGTILLVHVHNNVAIILIQPPSFTSIRTFILFSFTFW